MPQRNMGERIAIEYAFTSGAVSGEPRVFGRVYLATHGRGIIYMASRA